MGRMQKIRSHTALFVLKICSKGSYLVQDMSKVQSNANKKLSSPRHQRRPNAKDEGLGVLPLLRVQRVPHVLTRLTVTFLLQLPKAYVSGVNWQARSSYQTINLDCSSVWRP